MRDYRIEIAFIVGFVFFAQAAKSQSSLDGTWKIDTARTTFTQDRLTILVKDGKYRCDTCLPPIAVKADGADHQVKNSPYFDTVNVTIADASTVIEEVKEHGATVLTSRLTAPPAAGTAILEWSEPGTRSAGPGAGGVILSRIGKPKHGNGSHVVSGSWVVTSLLKPSPVVFTLHVEGAGTTLSMTVAGTTYHAMLKGPLDPPVAGERVRASALGPYTFTETLSSIGEPIREHRLMLNPRDSSIMDIIDTDHLTGISIVLHAIRQ